MGAYREYRNIEASLVDYIKAQLLADSWSGISVGKTFQAVEDAVLPAIVLQLVNSSLKRKEVGSGQWQDTGFVIIRMFATSDGQRLDLAKWLVDKFQSNIPYYAYTVTNGVVSLKTLTGYIRIKKIVENTKELEGVPGLEPEDRFRHKLSINVVVNTTA